VVATAEQNVACEARQRSLPDSTVFAPPHAFEVWQAPGHTLKTRGVAEGTKHCARGYISSAILVRDNRTSSANGAFGRHEAAVLKVVV